MRRLTLLCFMSLHQNAEGSLIRRVLAILTAASHQPIPNPARSSGANPGRTGCEADSASTAWAYGTCPPDTTIRMMLEGQILNEILNQK